MDMLVANPTPDGAPWYPSPTCDALMSSWDDVICNLGPLPSPLDLDPSLGWTPNGAPSKAQERAPPAGKPGIAVKTEDTHEILLREERACSESSATGHVPHSTMSSPNQPGLPMLSGDESTTMSGASRGHAAQVHVHAPPDCATAQPRLLWAGTSTSHLHHSTGALPSKAPVSEDASDATISCHVSHSSGCIAPPAQPCTPTRKRPALPHSASEKRGKAPRNILPRQLSGPHPVQQPAFSVPRSTATQQLGAPGLVATQGPELPRLARQPSVPPSPSPASPRGKNSGGTPKDSGAGTSAVLNTLSSSEDEGDSERAPKEQPGFDLARKLALERVRRHRLTNGIKLLMKLTSSHGSKADVIENAAEVINKLQTRISVLESRIQALEEPTESPPSRC